MSFLSDILEMKKEEVKKLRAARSLSSFGNEEFFNSQCMDIKQSLKNNNRLGIIAEIKKASPSKGILKDNFNHLKIAEEYFEAEVDAISILTDKYFFQGDILFLDQIAKFKSAPLLRKDFIIDEYQVFEAKAFGADAILLIAEALSQNQIKELTAAAKEIGLEVLLELHSESQLPKIDFTNNDFIGINNRDLETFDADINTTLSLIKHIPENVFITSESGLSDKDQLAKLFETNVKSVLVGEYFMKADKISSSVKEFKDWCTYAG
jgi:indole-3-glycerol phosphate synthase